MDHKEHSGEREQKVHVTEWVILYQQQPLITMGCYYNKNNAKIIFHSLTFISNFNFILNIFLAQFCFIYINFNFTPKTNTFNIVNKKCWRRLYKGTRHSSVLTWKTHMLVITCPIKESMSIFFVDYVDSVALETKFKQ